MPSEIEGIRRRRAEGAERIEIPPELAARVRALPQWGPFSPLRVSDDDTTVVVAGLLAEDLASLGRRLSGEAALAFAWHLAAVLAELHERGEAHGQLHPACTGLDPAGKLTIRPAIGLRVPADPDSTATAQATDCLQLAALFDALELGRLGDPNLALLLDGLRRRNARLRMHPARAARQALAAILRHHPDAEAALVKALGPDWRLEAGDRRLRRWVSPGRSTPVTALHEPARALAPPQPAAEVPSEPPAEALHEPARAVAPPQPAAEAAPQPADAPASPEEATTMEVASTIEHRPEVRAPAAVGPSAEPPPDKPEQPAEPLDAKAAVVDEAELSRPPKAIEPAGQEPATLRGPPATKSPPSRQGGTADDDIPTEDVVPDRVLEEEGIEESVEEPEAVVPVAPPPPPARLAPPRLAQRPPENPPAPPHRDRAMPPPTRSGRARPASPVTTLKPPAPPAHLASSARRRPQREAPCKLEAAPEPEPETAPQPPTQNRVATLSALDSPTLPPPADRSLGDLPKWAQARGVTFDESREAELGDGKWTEAARSLDEVREALPDTPVRELDLGHEPTFPWGWIAIGTIAVLAALGWLALHHLTPAP